MYSFWAKVPKNSVFHKEIHKKGKNSLQTSLKKGTKK